VCGGVAVITRKWTWNLAGRAAVALAVLLCVSCARTDTDPVVRHRELKPLLAHDVRIQSLPVGASTAVTGREYFYADGKYMGCGDRFVAKGTYRILGDAICVDRSIGRECRRLARNDAGRYSEVLEVDAARKLTRSLDVEIVQLTTRESCNSGGS